MGIVRVDQYDKDGRLRELGGGWFIYVAFCKMDEHRMFVKVGISGAVYDRIVTIEHNNPVAVTGALFAPAGSRKTAASLERQIQLAFAAWRTRGEWFLFDPSDKAVQAKFHGEIRSLYSSMIHQNLQWKKITPAQIQAYASIKMKESFQKIRLTRRKV